MKIIHENPYRIAGLLSNAPAKDFLKQQNKTKKLISIGQQVKSEYDFNFLEPISRSEKNVSKAFADTQQNPDKVSNSLFWFLNTNAYDATAIQYLINGDKEKALEIWEKSTSGKEITAKNFSCFNNLGTLKLLGSNQTEISEGITIKFKLIESNSFVDFVDAVADKVTYAINIVNERQKLVDKLLSQLNGKYVLSSTIKLFNGCSDSTKKDVSKKLTEGLILNLESLIGSTKNNRTQYALKAYDFGLKLFDDSKADLTSIKTILGVNDLKYKMIADKLANEILQCAIDYFVAWKKVTKEPCNKGVELLKSADSIAVSSQIKGRIADSIEGMNEWAKTALIEDDLLFITKKLEQFQNLSDTISNANSLVDSCTPKLQNIKSYLGTTDDFYLSISSAIVSNVQGMLVAVINAEQASYSVMRGDFYTLKDKVREAICVSEKIGKLDMVPQLRTQYTKNHSTLKGIASNLGISTRPPITSPTKPKITPPPSSTNSNTTRSTTSSGTGTSKPPSTRGISDEGVRAIWIICSVIGAILGAILGGWFIGGVIGFVIGSIIISFLEK